MSFEEFLWMDKIMWAKKRTKKQEEKALELYEQFKKLPRKTQDELIDKKWNLEINKNRG